MKTVQYLDFRPHPLLRGGHAQTLAGFYWPARMQPYRATATPILLPDGDAIVLHDDCPDNWQAAGRVVLLLHGMGGCHGSGYVVRLAERLAAAGIRAFRMDMRGLGAAVGKAKQVAHAGRFEDAAAAIDHIAQRCPDAELVLVGFSLGGNVALGAAANASRQSGSPLRRCIAIAPPVDLARCCHQLRQGVRQAYDRFLIRLLLQAWKATGGMVPEPRPRSIYEFDDRITAPVSGFRDAEDYYARCSSGPRLREITVPTRILAAQDDPVVDFQAVACAERSPHVELFVTKSGGHLGYMGSSGSLAAHRWLDELLHEWIEDWSD